MISFNSCIKVAWSEIVFLAIISLIYVIVDSAQGGEIWGNTVAAPIFKEISTQISHILNLQPDKTVPAINKDIKKGTTEE